MNQNNVLAGVVTYYPERERLLENLSELVRQVNKILIVDNGSEKLCEMIDSFPEEITSHLSVIYNGENLGIAQALGKIMNYAKEQEFKWVLTLDQDSVIEPELVKRYCEAANLEQCADVGMFTCLIKDRNFDDSKYEQQDADILDVPYCITSAAFTNVEKYFDTSGYDEKFFIDCVDFDICYLLSEKGYRVSRINYIGLYHEVGHGENRMFLGKPIVVYHHNPIRIYYLARNTVWMHKKHPQAYTTAVTVKKLLAIFIRIVLYERDKKEKIGKFFTALVDSKDY